MLDGPAFLTVHNVAGHALRTTVLAGYGLLDEFQGRLLRCGEL